MFFIFTAGQCFIGGKSDGGALMGHWMRDYPGSEYKEPLHFAMCFDNTTRRLRFRKNPTDPTTRWFDVMDDKKLPEGQYYACVMTTDHRKHISVRHVTSVHYPYGNGGAIQYLRHDEPYFFDDTPQYFLDESDHWYHKDFPHIDLTSQHGSPTGKLS